MCFDKHFTKIKSKFYQVELGHMLFQNLKTQSSLELRDCIQKARVHIYYQTPVYHYIRTQKKRKVLYSTFGFDFRDKID